MEPIASFLKIYNRRRTRMTRVTAIRRYFAFIYDRPAPRREGRAVDLTEYEVMAVQYLDEVKAGDRVPLNDLVGFKNHLDEMAPMTARNYLAGVLTFLEHHGIDLGAKDLQRVKRGMAPNRPISEDEALTREKIAKILNHSTMAMKALILVLASSGMRVGEALQLRMEDVDLEADPVTVHIRKEIAKTRLPRITFVSSEAAPVLREWVAYRQEYTKKKKGPRMYRTRKPDPRLFPFGVSATTEMFTLSVRKAGLYKADPNTRKATIHLHSFRKYFRSNLVKGGGNAIDITERLMGHVGPYIRIPAEDVAKFYRESEHHLFISPVLSSQDREDMKELANTNTELQGKVATLEAQLQILTRLIQAPSVSGK